VVKCITAKRREAIPMPVEFGFERPACVGLAAWNLFTLLYRGLTRLSLVTTTTEWQHTRNEINAAMIFMRFDYVITYRSACGLCVN